MVFSSTAFLFAFMPVTLALYFIKFFGKNKRKETAKKNFILLVSSLIFYAWGEPVYVLLMMLSIVFNYFIGLDIEQNKGSKGKMKLILIFGIAFNVFALGFFKYSGFVVDSINSIFGLDIKFNAPNLPIGISFYTFQIISYIVDVYRGVKAQKKLVPFACYVTMFPQLIAGPIVQYGDIEKQLNRRVISREKFTAGILIFIRGLGKKVLFANTIGNFSTQISAIELSDLSVVTAWLGIICYTLQIYFDFSGYSDMAIGLGKMLGFDFIQNFRFPYAAKSITDFWRKWHISLSSWFRDYIYIPMGGNRVGVARHIFNILFVWTLTGLWHGAAWNFIAWGGFYGILLLVEKYLLKNVLERIPLFLRHIGTMIVVMIGWVLFSKEDFTSAFEYIKILFGMGKAAFYDSTAGYYLSSSWFSILVMSLSSFGLFTKIPRVKNYHVNIIAMIIGYTTVFIICVAYLVSETYNPFLYFRF